MITGVLEDPDRTEQDNVCKRRTLCIVLLSH